MIITLVIVAGCEETAAKWLEANASMIQAVTGDGSAKAFSVVKTD